MSPDEEMAAVTVVAIPSQKALLMCPYVSSGKFSVLAPRCSRALLHNDDDCFYYHSWRNNVVIAFGTLSSFLT